MLNMVNFVIAVRDMEEEEERATIGKFTSEHGVASASRKYLTARRKR